MAIIAVLLVAAATLLSATNSGPPVASPTQHGCRQIGLWIRYLRRSLNAQQSCSRLGLESGRYCSAAGFDEAACIAEGDNGGGKALADRHLRALALAEQHRAAMWNGTCAFTISSWNNAGVVQVFLRSILTRNPLLTCVAWVIADHPKPYAQSPLIARIFSRLDALRAEWPAVAVHLITTEELRRHMAYSPLELAFRYPRKAFNTAIKPHAFTHLFASGARRVLYFDPDIHFYSHVDEIALLLHWRSFVVAPHQTWSTPDDGEALTDLKLMQCGVFNYGFVAMSDAHPQYLAHHLEWWAAKLRYQQFEDFAHGMFYDQNWANFIPSFYPRAAYEILLDPRYDVAYWNLHYRGQHLSFEAATGTARYAGLPLVFYHFSGTSTTTSITERASPHQTSVSPYQTRYVMADFPQLNALFDDYRRKIVAHNYREIFGLPYGFDYFTNGVPIAGWMRTVYAEMSEVTRTAVRKEHHVVGSVSLASRLTSANPFSGAHKGTIWAWLFTPAEKFQGALADGAGCTGELSVNVVVKLFERLELDPAGPRGADGCSRLLAYLPLILSYLTEDLLTPFVVADVRRLIKGTPGLHADGAERLCSEGSPSDAGFSFLCAAVRKGRRNAAALQSNASGKLAHHKVSAAFQRVTDHLHRLRATTRGVSVMGYFPHALGIADAARLTYRALEAHRPLVEPTAVPVVLPLPAFPELTSGMDVSTFTVHRTTIIVVNADQSTHLVRDHPGHAYGRYWIGVWYWELEQFPSGWRDAALAYDEIWASSGFIAESIRNELATSPLTKRIPVLVMPLGLPVPPIRAETDRSLHQGPSSQFLNLPRRAFVFLTTFDFNSYYERKRPDFVAEAFKLAFGGLLRESEKSKQRPVHLVIKSMNGAMHREKRELLRKAAAGWANIHLVDTHLSKAAMHAMHAAADCFVSLHSSEGYGLNILRPLMEAVPVIATLYSGNMEFQQFLPPRYLDLLGVGYELEEIQHDVGPYTAGNKWARPNISQAAAAMRRAAHGQLRGEIRALAVQGAQTLASKFSPRATGEPMVKRLREIDGLVDARARAPPRSAADDKELCCWIKRPDWQASLSSREALRHHFQKQHTSALTCSCSSLSSTAIDQAASVLNAGGLILKTHARGKDAIYCYWLRYNDLQSAIGTFEDAKAHLAQYGESEGRSTSCKGIDPKAVAAAKKSLGAPVAAAPANKAARPAAAAAV